MKSSMDMHHGNATWICRTFMQNVRAARKCSTKCITDMKHGHTVRTCSMDMKHGHPSWTSSKYKQQGHAAGTDSMDLGF